VPLSENEQRLLEQMERALYAEDPKFASALRGADPRTHARRRIIKASAGFIAGIALLMVGVITQIVPVSVVGFVVMLGCAFIALNTWRQMPAPAPPGSPGPAGAIPLGGLRTRAPRPSRAPRTRQSILNRFEDRWNRRRDENGR
jgi:hypothetical protein